MNSSSEEKKINLLLVDDEIMVIKAILRLLDKTKYTIHATTDPLEVPALLSAVRMDIVICDQNMPLLTGLEVCRKVRESQPSAVCILLSGNFDARVYHPADMALIDYFVRKPWDNFELLSAVDSASGRLQ